MQFSKEAAHQVNVQKSLRRESNWNFDEISQIVIKLAATHDVEQAKKRVFFRSRVNKLQPPILLRPPCPDFRICVKMETFITYSRHTMQCEPDLD